MLSHSRRADFVGELSQVGQIERPVVLRADHVGHTVFHPHACRAHTRRRAHLADAVFSETLYGIVHQIGFVDQVQHHPFEAPHVITRPQRPGDVAQGKSRRAPIGQNVLRQIPTPIGQPVIAGVRIDDPGIDFLRRLWQLRRMHGGNLPTDPTADLGRRKALRRASTPVEAVNLIAPRFDADAGTLFVRSALREQKPVLPDGFFHLTPPRRLRLDVGRSVHPPRPVGQLRPVVADEDVFIADHSRKLRCSLQRKRRQHFLASIHCFTPSKYTASPADLR